MKKSLLFSLLSLWIFTACDRVAVDEQPTPAPKAIITEFKTKSKAPIAIDLSKNHTLTSQSALVLKGNLQHGTAKFVSNGLLVYTPSQNVTTATENIGYQVCVNNDCQDFQVQVNIVNQLPTPNSEQGCVQLITDVVTLNVVPGTVSSKVIDVLANDYFCAGVADTTLLQVAVAPERGFVYRSAGKLVYNFNPSAQSQVNPDVFVYKITHGNPATTYYGVVAVNIQTQAVFCPLVVNNDSYTIQNASSSTLNIFANDSFCTDSLSINPQIPAFQIITQPAHGVLSAFAPYVGITFTPTAGYVGTDSFVYRLTYQNGSVKQGTVSLNIGCSTTTNANNDSYIFPNTQIPPNGVTLQALSNDAYCPQNFASLQITQQADPAQGVGKFAVVNNQIVYILPSGNPTFTGTVSCVYQLCASGSCDSATITVQITN